MSEVVNKLRILGEDAYTERRVVEKIVNTLPEKYEITISSIENSGRDTSDVSLAELTNALYAIEQRREKRQ